MVKLYTNHPTGCISSSPNANADTFRTLIENAMICPTHTLKLEKLVFLFGNVHGSGQTVWIPSQHTPCTVSDDQLTSPSQKAQKYTTTPTK